MLRKYSNTRSLGDNIKLGVLTAIVAGMVNVASFMLFYSFSSNVTGYFAILASEVSQNNYYQIAIVLLWIMSFFLGSFISNFIVIHFNRRNTYLAHAIPIMLELICILGVAIYGTSFYKGTLFETELMLMILLLSMGLQNGLTASISNFAVKTTHLTGATTDLAILFSMFTHKKYRNNKDMKDKAKLLISIFSSYLLGAFIAAFLYQSLKFNVFFIVVAFLTIVIFYDLSKIYKFNRSLKVYKLKKQEAEQQKPDNIRSNSKQVAIS